MVILEEGSFSPSRFELWYAEIGGEKSFSSTFGIEFMKKPLVTPMISFSATILRLWSSFHKSCLIFNRLPMWIISRFRMVDPPNSIRFFDDLRRKIDFFEILRFNSPIHFMNVKKKTCFLGQILLTPDSKNVTITFRVYFEYLWYHDW